MQSILSYSSKIIVILTVTAFSALMVACQWNNKDNFFSGYSIIPIGTTLELNRDINIPPHKTGIYIQGGKALQRPLVNEFYANCRIEVFDLSTVVTVVRKDVFTVNNVIYDSELVMLKNQMYASANNLIAFDGATAEIMTIEIYLQSQNQPNVFRMMCGHWEDVNDAFFPSLQQIKQALGELVTVTLPH